MLRARVAVVLVAGIMGCRENTQKFSHRYESGPYLQETRQGCVQISALFVTPQLKAIQALSAGSDSIHIDHNEFEAELRKHDRSSLEFRLLIAPTAECRDTLNFHNSDVVYGPAARDGNKGIDDAVRAFNESLSTKLWLKVGDERIRPSLCHVESSFGLDNSRQVWLIFKSDQRLKNALSRARETELIAEDPVQGKGLFVLSWPKKVFASGV